MKTLSIDLETYSSIDLAKCGVYRYAESPDFEILLFGYAFDDEPATVIDLTEDVVLPDDIMNALFDKSIQKCAFNAGFERTCLAAYLGREMPPEQWSCTAVLARELGLPGSLEKVGEVIGLPEDKKKLKTGKALIRYFSIPCKPTKSNGGRTRNLPHHDPDKWQLYIDYNRTDVESERAIRQRLLTYSVAESEQALWEIDQKINDRGVLADLQLAKSAIEIDEVIQNKLMSQAQELGIKNPKSTNQVKDFIREITGITVSSLERKYVNDIRAQANNATVDLLLSLRAGLTKTSTKKYEAVLRAANADHRIRGLTQFYGANRTGRWAGRLVQMQNLPQNKMPDDDLNAARKMVKAKDYDGLDLCFDDIPGTLSQLVRTAFIPKTDCKFIVADFSAIEARVIAWLANEKWRIDVFNSHGKIYEASAEQMFHLPAGSVEKGDPMRQKGKIAELALGYGGSVGALKAMGALDMGLEESELQPLVNRWRATNRAITAFWWNVGDAAYATVRYQVPQLLLNGKGIRFRKEGPLLRLRLPSGRELSYVKPKLDNKSLTYDGTVQTTGQWGRIESYGPKIVENIVQATARDCLAESIIRLEAKDYPVVFHVHDEVIVEVPKSVSVQEISAIMSAPIDWAEGLPLRADAYECEYYRKD